MIIKIKELCKTIHKKSILDNVNLEFCSGKIYGLSGPNGSGKTMLLKAMCGIVIPTSGLIEIDGEVLGRDIDFPPSVGLLIENPAFLDGYSGFENLKQIARVKNVIGDADIKKAIEDVGLDSEDKKKYRHYSLGMKQKLGIACALMEKPDLVVLDEPTNALDSRSSKDILEVILSVKRWNGIAVVACHDLEVIEALADEVINMFEGKAAIEKSR